MLSTIYDAPNGNVVDTLDQGFNYITIKNTVDGWTEIDTDRWVQTENLKEVLPSRFGGVLLTRRTPLPDCLDTGQCRAKCHARRRST